ncbi:aminodeoxychorismate synthase component I [Chryseobacterium sp. A301]
MSQDFDAKFNRMDILSLRKEPFFFMVDFEGTELVVYSLEEVVEGGIYFDFPTLKLEKVQKEVLKDLSIKAMPESIHSYKEGFDHVHRNLMLGNSYLANYTCRTRIESSSTLEDFYYGSKAKYKVYFQNQFCSFSPETFVEISGDKMYTYPMKGTIEASVENAEEILREDPKEKAEHYTVVDLLRNDLSRVCDEVQVDEFQRIDYLKTNQKDLLAMSSQISGRIKPEFSGKIGSILKTLLPAGSILGAPKAKTMEIILEAEKQTRGWYTGVAGVFDGESLDSCVLIRFIEQEENSLFFRSGGGITHQSVMEQEYQEMINKIYVPIH